MLHNNTQLLLCAKPMRTLFLLVILLITGLQINTAQNCPSIQKNFGAPCNDGNPQTIKDRVRNDCKCRGDYFSALITVKCPKDTVLVSTSKYGTVLTFDEFGMFKSVAGACAGITEVKRTSGYYSGYPFEPNALIFEEYVATDKCGNKSSCSFFVKTTAVKARAITDGSGAGSSGSNLLVNNLSPNPAQNKLAISLNSEIETETELRIFNTLGQTMLVEKRSLNTGMNEINLDISALQNGFYFFSTNQNEQAPMKFVKN